MHILHVIFILLEVVLLFNLLIFVHELGHFLAARWRGLKADRFAIWFGKPIWKKEINGVEFVLGWIPAGGYVSLPQMAPMDAIEGRPEDGGAVLPPVSALDKIIVAFAGPLFSFLLAVVFAVLVFVVGRPVSEAESTRTIGRVEKGSPADRAGLRAGDEILEIEGHPVTKWGGMGSSVTWRIVRSEGEVVPVKIRRGDEILTVETRPEKQKRKAWQRAALRQLMMEPAQTPIIAGVATNSPAQRAGLQPGDEIRRVNGEKPYHFAQASEFIQKYAPLGDIQLQIGRGEREFAVSLRAEVPEKGSEGRPLIGITNWAAGGLTTLARPGVVEQIVGSVDAMVGTFGALFSRKSDIKAQHLSGPVKIVNIYYVLFESPNGWRLALWFSVIMNVNLALLNLLPVPVLDGGHITLAVIEAIRRKPVHPRLLNILQSSCAMLIIGYMLYILWFDAQDLLPEKGRKEQPAPELKFAPPGAPVPPAVPPAAPPR